MTAKAKEQEPGFDKALERLEAIVGEMEGGKLGIETMIERFEEGQKLIHWCNAKLNDVEHRIEVLVKKGDELSVEPFVDEDAESTTGTVRGDELF